MSNREQNGVLRGTLSTNEDLQHIGGVHDKVKCNDTGLDDINHDMSVAHGGADGCRSGGQEKHGLISSADFVLPKAVDSAESAKRASKNSLEKQWSTAMANSDKQ